MVRRAPVAPGVEDQPRAVGVAEVMVGVDARAALVAAVDPTHAYAPVVDADPLARDVEAERLRAREPTDELRGRLGLLGRRQHVGVLVGPRRVVDGAPPRKVVAEQVRVVRVDHLNANRRPVVTARVGEAFVGQVAVLGDAAVGGHDQVHAELASLEHRDRADRRARHRLVDDELADGAAGAVAPLELEHVVVQEVGDLEAGRRRELLPGDDEGVRVGAAHG